MQEFSSSPCIRFRLVRPIDATGRAWVTIGYGILLLPLQADHKNRASDAIADMAYSWNMSFPLDRPARIAVFASGRGSNLEALLQAFPPEGGLGRVVLVVSDNRDAPALHKAVQAQVEAEYVPWPKNGRVGFEAVALKLLLEHHVDLLLLAGFMRLLSARFVQEWAGRILNIHPSLLPDFPGLHPQRQALEAGVGESGCTVHFVDEGIDTGPIVLQRKVAVLPGDSEESLAARIIEVEHLAYPEAVRKVLAGEGLAKGQAPNAKR